jgi:hypothetical protein
MRFWPADPVWCRASDLPDHDWDSMHVFWCFYGLCLLTDLGLQHICGRINATRNQWWFWWIKKRQEGTPYMLTKLPFKAENEHLLCNDASSCAQTLFGVIQRPDRITVQKQDEAQRFLTAYISCTVNSQASCSSCWAAALKLIPPVNF